MIKRKMNRQYLRSLRRLGSKAEQFAKDKEKASRLVLKAFEKANKNKDILKGIWNDLSALLRLVRAWIRGQYRDVSWQTIVFAIAAIIYFADPFDFIPDPVPFVGFIDDATVIGLLFTSIRGDIKRFLDWEEEQKSLIYNVERG